MMMGDMDPAAANLSLDDPACIRAMEGCLAFHAAENASQAAIPWASQFEYGHWTTYYWVIIVGVLAVVHFLQVWRDRKVSNSSHSESNPRSIFRKLEATGRLVFYRRFRTPAILDIPSMGIFIFLLITIIFLTGLVFVQRPYYREHLGYGSPPIAIRSGLIATACVPILVALSGKANIITFLTGISHERLNVIHRWVAWMSFVISLIHAIPFFIASDRDYGWGGSERVKYEFYSYGKTGADEYTGTPAIGILFGLCILSLPFIRKRFYESFYLVHILLAITYLGLLFWHSDNLLDSWAYLWATLAVWIASWAARTFWFNRALHLQDDWFRGAVTTLVALPGDVTRIEVWPSGNCTWRPGQHVFLRFGGLSPLDNHPFTICSVREPAKSEESEMIPVPLVLLARAHDGFTRKLASYVKANPDTSTKTSVILDGPYGGINRPLEGVYDSMILLAGGTGISACIPWLSHVVLMSRHGSTRLRLKRIVLIWAMRRADAVSWAHEELKRVFNPEFQTNAALEVIGKFHITGADDQGLDKAKAEEDAVEESKGASDDYRGHLAEFGSCVSGRPVMKQALDEFIRADEKTTVLGCGPEGFRIDLANATAGSQMRVLKGECDEIALHLETFGW